MATKCERATAMCRRAGYGCGTPNLDGGDLLRVACNARVLEVYAKSDKARLAGMKDCEAMLADIDPRRVGEQAWNAVAEAIDSLALAPVAG